VVAENASSIALLVNSARPPRRYKKDLLLIGAPVQAVSEFPALKYADAEIKQVKAAFPPLKEKVIAGADATPSAFFASHPEDHRLVHFVTHGIPNRLVPLDSAVVLSPGSDKQYKLYAREIKNISEKKLLNADLVTISACYSAGNKTYAGEGQVGLAWAFMRAGAHQVIGSLWEVDDEATPAFMGSMYAQIRKGASPADALHTAKLKMLSSPDHRHHEPYYWASLQLYTGP
jgi:CHAT domain-containing protein